MHAEAAAASSPSRAVGVPPRQAQQDPAWVRWTLIARRARSWSAC